MGDMMHNSKDSVGVTVYTHDRCGVMFNLWNETGEDMTLTLAEAQKMKEYLDKALAPSKPADDEAAQ